MLTREQKQRQIDSLKEQLGGAEGLFVMSFTGLKVGEVTELRRKIREANGNYVVVKNRLARIAVAGTEKEPLQTLLGGMTAVAYTSVDPVALAKALADFAKGHEKLTSRGGFVEHVVLDALIVVYPYVTGLVAGAFIMASLVRVFNVKLLEPVYRLSTLLTSLAFLLCAPLPLLFHLGHPERCYEVMMTPHLTSPMAIFGFVYAWYLMAVLLLELWFDYRRYLVMWSQTCPGLKGTFYRLLTVGVTDISEPALKLDAKIGHILSVVGIPSAFLLHGYVGFIFGSVKANPWWGNVLMPIIFIMSAVVSGIALCVFNYMALTWIRRRIVDMKCLDVMGMYLFYALVVDAYGTIQHARGNIN